MQNDFIRYVNTNVGVIGMKNKNERLANSQNSCENNKTKANSKNKMSNNKQNTKQEN